MLKRYRSTLAAVLIAALPFFSVSQKTLIPLLSIIALLAIHNNESSRLGIEKSGKIRPDWTWIATGLTFTLLSAKNAFNDIETGLISGTSELTASLTRAALYTIAPLILCLANRRSLISLVAIGHSLIAGLQLKILTCLVLTLAITGEVAKKSYILQFPTLEIYVTTWTGPYFLITAAIACFLLSQHPDKNNNNFNATLITLSAAQAFYCAIALNNLTCSIAGMILISLLACNLQVYSVLLGLVNRIRTGASRLPRLSFIIIGSCIAVGIISKRLREPLFQLIHALRIDDLWTRNDRLELFAQGLKRLRNHIPNARFLLDGPPEFQRPICFSASEVMFTPTESCHDYWHFILWDSFRNSGYIGLILGAIIVYSFAVSLWVYICSRQSLNAAAIICCMFIIFTTPIVEVGSGEILPLMLTLTLISSSHVNRKRFVVKKS
jgi:hypothetical protein